MAHCCDGCIYERPGGQCAREDTYIEDRKTRKKNAVELAAMLLAVFAIMMLIVSGCIFTLCHH